MTWKIEVTTKAEKYLKKLDPQWQRAIRDFVEKELRTATDPRRMGKPLVGNLAGLWRYRLGIYRIICHIDDDKLIVLIVEIGHRNEIYRKK